MKIKGTNVRVSIVNILVVGILTLFLVGYVAISGDYGLLVMGIPVLVLLVLIPLGLNYMSQSQYSDLVPIYEAEAKKVRINSITDRSIGDIVRIEGIVERVLFKSLNRPQFLVADRTGEISVKMFTSPTEDVFQDDHVEVYGQVIKRYVLVGDPAINAVIIRRIGGRNRS